MTTEFAFQIEYDQGPEVKSRGQHFSILEQSVSQGL